MKHLGLYFFLCDYAKLENVLFLFQTCQREIKRLREKELALQSEIATASREILRLRELLKDYNTDASNI